MMVYHNGNEVLETEIYSYASEHAHDMASRSLVGHFFQKQNLKLFLSKVRFLAVGDTLDLRLTSIGNDSSPIRITMCVSMNEEWL